MYVYQPSCACGYTAGMFKYIRGLPPERTAGSFQPKKRQGLNWELTSVHSERLAGDSVTDTHSPAAQQEYSTPSTSSLAHRIVE